MSLGLVEVDKDLGVALNTLTAVTDSSVVVEVDDGDLRDQVDGSIWLRLLLKVSLQSSDTLEGLASGFLRLSPGLSAVGRLLLDSGCLLLVRGNQVLCAGGGGEDARGIGSNAGNGLGG